MKPIDKLFYKVEKAREIIIHAVVDYLNTIPDKSVQFTEKICLQSILGIIP